MIGFDDFENDYNSQTTELKTVLQKKSNIKDVCALLDMKSSKINKST